MKIFTAICIVVKRSQKRNRIIPKDIIEPPPTAPRTLLSAISRVMVLNDIRGRNRNDTENNIQNNFSFGTSHNNDNILNMDSSVYESSGYIPLNNILRESERNIPMNNLVTECLFLDNVPRKNRQQSLTSNWALKVQNPTCIKIGNLLMVL